MTRAPRCAECPAREQCAARADGKQEKIPPPKAKIARRTIFAVSLVVRNRAGAVLLERRPDTGMWAGMWQAPTLERETRPSPELGAALADELRKALGLRGKARRVTAFEHTTAHRGGVTALVDEELPVPDLRFGLLLVLSHPPDGQPEARLDLTRAGGVEQDVIDPPVRRNGRETALGDDQQDRQIGSCRTKYPTQGAGTGKVTPAVDEQQITGRSVQQCCRLCGENAHLMAQQPERGQHMIAGLDRIGHQQNTAHGPPPDPSHDIAEGRDV